MVNILIKIFVLLTPFFALSMFISVTAEMSNARRQFSALKTTLAVMVICLLIYFFGEHVFKYLGITIDAFRIGAGTILLITAVELVLGKNKGGSLTEGQDDEEHDISVVPMAIPYTIGPGTIGALLVMGGEAQSGAEKLSHCGGIILAVVAFGIILLLANVILKLIGKRGIQILSKMTGLVLAGLAAQVIFTGIKNFLFTR